MNTIPVLDAQNSEIEDVSLTSTIPTETPKKKNYLPWLLGIPVLVIVLIVISLILVSKSKPISTGSSTQTPVPQEQIAVDSTNVDISTWKTYINSNFGIALRYPSNLIVNLDDQNDIVTIKSDPTNRPPGIEISSFSRQNYVSLDHWLAQKDKECEEGKQLAEKTGGDSDCVIYSRLGERKINQYVSSKVSWSCCGTSRMIRYIIEGLDKVYFIDLFPDKHFAAKDYDEDGSKLAKIYQQFLSTFQLFTKSESDELIKFVKNRLKMTDESLILIEKIEGNYAYGTGGIKDGGGFYWAAAKKDGQWNYAFSGNGIPFCSQVEIFPVGTFAGKFDDCYQTQKRMINRNNSVKYKLQAKLYTSKRLGLNLYYLPAQHDSVKEEGNRIYVTSGGSKQFVEIFSKKADETMIDAINRILLTKFDKEKCIVISKLEKEQTKLYDSSTPLWTLPIGKLYEIEDKTRQYVDDEYYCPGDYSQANGARYFVEDENDKTKFYFYELGQYTAYWEIEQDKIWKP